MIPVMPPQPSPPLVPLMAAICRSLLDELPQERLDALVLEPSKRGNGSTGYANVLRVVTNTKAGQVEHFQARAYDERIKRQVYLARVQAFCSCASAHN